MQLCVICVHVCVCVYVERKEKFRSLLHSLNKILGVSKDQCSKGQCLPGLKS